MEGEDNFNIHEGAVGGEDWDSTSPKSVHQDEETPPIESQGALNSENVAVMNNFLNKDIDLSRDQENRIHEGKCNQQYFKEITYKKGVKPSMPLLNKNIPVPERSNPGQISQREIAIAEHQHSFQSLSSESREIPAMPDCNDNNNLNVEMPSPGCSVVVTSVTGTRPQIGLTEDNTTSNLPVNLTSTDSNNQSNTTNNSSGSRYASRLRTAITDNMLVISCPKEFIELISSHLNGKDGKNWEDLLSLYNWNYKSIVLFRNKEHPRGYFCSILNEPEFQVYTIGFLKGDLGNLPKKDTLSDIIEWIENYNKTL